MSSPGILVLRQKLAHLELDQFEQLGVVDQVDLVQEHHQRGNADLAGQKNVLAGLRHRAVGGRHHQDRAVHLGSTGDHVLHIVGVAGAVDMGVVAGRRLVFDVRRRDGDAARLLFGRRVDLVVGLVFAKILGDRRRQRRLAVVDVTDRANVHMRLGALEFTFCHFIFPKAARQRLDFECGAISDNGRKTQGASKRGVRPDRSRTDARPHRNRRSIIAVRYAAHVGIAAGAQEPPHSGHRSSALPRQQAWNPTGLLALANRHRLPRSCPPRTPLRQVAGDRGRQKAT